tara:strand:+ start:504 stop:1070 length:567 start_codon:yes stop_codon:yes gene_type:complete
MSDDNYNEKDVAFYSATLSAWYTTKFEKDKHLLSLSTAAIGLLVTLVTTIGTSEVCTAAMYILAVLAFLICVLTILAIFDRNSKHLEDLVKETDDRDQLLSTLDKVASSSFVLGIMFTLLVGLFSGIENHRKEESTMTKDTGKMVTTNQSTEKKSVDGAAAMRPSKPQDQSGGGQSGQSGSSSGEGKK